MLQIAIIVIVLLAVIMGIISFLKSRPKKLSHFLPQWRVILEEHVKPYRDLSPERRMRFEQRIMAFLSDVKITGVKCEIEDKDRVLVAAGAVIPFLWMPQFGYPNLDRVLIYPGRFNFEHEFGQEAEDKRVSGMVGTGYMNRTMILSKPDLYAGFTINNDKKNVSVHEFIHLMDMADGAADGIPEAFLEKPYILPWINLMSKEIENIQKGNSSIRAYGAFNKQEFLAVASEYFFERPKLLKQKHPALYEMLHQVYVKEPISK